MGTVATWWHCTARYLQGLLTCRPGFCIDCKFKVGGKNTHRMAIFSPGDCWGGDPKGVAAQSERLLQGDSEVQGLAVVLDFWGN